MKTLHYSIITGIGISILTIIGLFIMFAPPQDQSHVSTIHPPIDNYPTQNFSAPITVNKTEQIQNEEQQFRQSAQHIVWNYDVDGQILSITTSHNGSYVVAGTRLQEGHADDNEHQGSVYFFDKTGNLIWKYDSTRKIAAVSASDDGQYVLASGYQIAPGPAGIYENGAMYLLDKNGNMLWNYAPNDYGKILVSALSSDGSHVAAASGTNLVCFDNQGKNLWNYTSSSDINFISLSSNGSNIIASSGNTIRSFDIKGNLLWTFNTDYGYSQARLSPDGKYIVANDAASGWDGKIYLIDNKGNLIKEDQVGSPVLSLSISENNHIAIGTNWATMLFNSTGDMIWNDKMPSQVAVSSNGSFLAAISGAGDGVYLTYFDNHGNILSRHPIGSWGHIAISGDSRYVALGYSQNGGTNNVQFFEVPLEYVLGLATSDIPQFNLQSMQTSNDTHVSITSTNGTELYTEVEVGQTVQLPYDLNFETNYTSSDLQLSINSSSNIDARISPVFPTEIINGIPPGNKVITIHAGPHTISGDYVLTVNGNGRTEDSSTGWITPLDNTILAKIHVHVKPYSGQISIHVGTTHYEMRTFCVDMKPSGQSCGTGPIYEEVPITVYSNAPQEVKLDALGLEKGAWVKFLPDHLVAKPNGTITKMILAGYEIPAMSNPLADEPLTIQATSYNETQTAIVSVRPSNLISVLHSPSPISLGTITTNSDGTNFAESGVVYDPLDGSNGTLPVKLSVKGFLNGNDTIFPPLWLSVNIPDSSFTLNATQPYYFIITVNTHNAPSSGTYYIAIDEDIGGQHFIQPEAITIENIRH
ncbi:MAG: PQQ-binding-like beta-propeller repeat protein [Thaumarchaeota archaeon]|nr:PQQ-like beta-propeller repeat protein [Candidatus Nitrosotalea sp.]MDE1813248.1 PQQ-binding-like beta-propeller repeat protein [Nitrososphaerota archaeon]